MAEPSPSAMKPPGFECLRILIVTHSPVLPTGTAETTRSIFNTLLELYPDDYELHQVGLQHVGGVADAKWPIHLTRVEVHPSRRWILAKSDLNGEETLPTLLVRLKPDVVFAFNDPQDLEHLCVGMTERRAR